MINRTARLHVVIIVTIIIIFFMLSLPFDASIHYRCMYDVVINTINMIVREQTTRFVRLPSTCDDLYDFIWYTYIQHARVHTRTRAVHGSVFNRFRNIIRILLIFFVDDRL